MTTRLSVNVNKIATLRNARGGDMPNLVKTVLAIESYGAEGITVHPRPDERHIRYQDVYDIAAIVTQELNIEGNPLEPDWMTLVLEVRPTQATLVPDHRSQLTSNHGWDTLQYQTILTEKVRMLKDAGIRVSIFIDPHEQWLEPVLAIGADRIELYTEAYASNYAHHKACAIEPYVKTALRARELGLTINAGHDLNIENLTYFIQTIPWIAEVSIGHALMSDALFWGLKETIQRYRTCLNSSFSMPLTSS